MAIKPISTWVSSYEKEMKAAFDKAAETGDGSSGIIQFWKKWINDNGQGIEIAAPYASSGTPSQDSVLSEPLISSKSVVQSAQILASAWRSWYASISWAPPPPAPPFKVITLAESSPSGMAAAYAALFSGLVAEMTGMPADPMTAFAEKAVAMSNLFSAATLAAGVQLTGLGLPDPPPPVVLPLVPVL